MNYLLKMSDKLGYPLNKLTKRKVIMYAIAIALFVSIVTIVPNILEWYPEWIKESTTPAFFKNMPYLPMWSLLILAVASFIFLIYASIREHKIQKKKESETQIVEERLDKLEQLKIKERMDELDDKLGIIERLNKIDSKLETMETRISNNSDVKND